MRLMFFIWIFVHRYKRYVYNDVTKGPPEQFGHDV